MKEGWDVKQLKDYCTDYKSAIVDGPFGSNLKREHFVDSGIPVLKIQNVKSHKIVSKNLTYVTPKKAKELKRHSYKKNDIVLTKLGDPLGVSAIVENIEDGIIVADLVRIRADNINTKYLCYQLNAPAIKSYINSQQKGATRPRIKISTVRELPIIAPPLPEQKRIVAILDEAFTGIDKAIANAKKNLANARELFDSTLHAIFQRGVEWESITLAELIERGWITSHLDGNHGSDYPRKAEFIGHGVPYISANCLKHGAVDLSLAKYLSPQRAASMRKGIAQNQDVLFAHNATVGPVALLYTDLKKVILSTSLTYYRCNRSHIMPEYLVHYMRSPEFKRQYELVMRQSTRNQVPITKQREFSHIIPPIKEQGRIAKHLDGLSNEASRLQAIYKRKLDDLVELKQSILQKAFAGELTLDIKSAQPAEATKAAELKTTSPEFTANVLAFAHYLHAAKKRDKTFGRVKAQKTLHMVESIGDIDLGRKPIKDAAGPNDFPHMLRAENWAKENQFFELVDRGKGYDFKKLSRYTEMIAGALAAVKPYRKELEKVVDLVAPMNSREAELFATVHAAWNNLILDGTGTNDKAIIRAARNEWHADKMKIPEHEFQEAIRKIRSKGLVPDGQAKRVGGQESLF